MAESNTPPKKSLHGADLILDRLFHESHGKNTMLFSIADQIYDLPEISDEFPVSRDFFAYARQRNFFVTLVLYDGSKRIYLSPTANTWILPGGSIRQGEYWHEAVSRAARSVSHCVKLGEVEPIAKVTNNFTYENLSHTHLGMAFMARIRNIEDLDRERVQGCFVHPTQDELDFIKAYSNRKVVDLAIERIDEKSTEIQEDEISSNEEYKGRYAFHNNVVKRFILTDSRKKKTEFNAAVAKLIGPSSSILDVSCGDSKLISELGRTIPSVQFAVGNDISWSQIASIHDKFSRVIYTNHDAVDLPFKDKSFETALCCNTLHHMPSRSHLQGLFENVRRVAKRVVFVEIENPQATGGFPAALNRYWYQKFLGDVGGAYMDESEFKAILEASFPSPDKIEFDSFRNVQGRYMMASVDFGEMSDGERSS